MSLFVVATPIGNPADLSVRAREILAHADLVIGEELKELRQILKAAGVQAKSMDQLNEHSGPGDLKHFVTEAREKSVALVSDCGTPGFCDPGADLVDACYEAGIEVQTAPGPSSLIAFLSICGLRLDRFLFFGFLPAKNDLRERAWIEIKKQTIPVILMETPYRSVRLCADLAAQVPRRYCVLAADLTLASQKLIRGQGSDFAKQDLQDVEPIALVMPATFRK
jgi:16S rRNA (cytidine1402-2'-O)-methyltransferase